MSHDHHSENMNDKKLLGAILANMLLTVAQVIGGVVSGSLSLIADALHNFSDAASLIIAWVARKIGRKEADEMMSFGYKRAELIATLINLVTLVIVGIYLIYEGIWRIFEPQIIEGWLVVIVAGIALIIDVATAMLTFKMSKDSMNIKAAFLHNVSDALASLGVIIAGTLIILYDWYWVDTLITFVIAAYVLLQAKSMLPATIHILMEGAPSDIDQTKMMEELKALNGVINVHHLHLWHLDEHKNALEAHVLIEDFSQTQEIKVSMKNYHKEHFDIVHSTLEFETVVCQEDCVR